LKRTGSMTPRSFKSAIPRSTWRSPSPVLHEMLRMRDASLSVMTLSGSLDIPEALSMPMCGNDATFELVVGRANLQKPTKKQARQTSGLRFYGGA
jgi:hypothetical protein